MQRHFDTQMQELLQKLVLLGQTAEAMVGLSLRMLLERDAKIGDEVSAKEMEANKLQLEIDDAAVKLTATHQPVASDVRFLFMASRIASELERIGDQAINICQCALQLIDSPPMKPTIDIPVMAELSRQMVKNAMQALSAHDCTLAEKVFEQEDKVDDYRDQIFRVLLTYMMSEPGTIPNALSLILISRNLERVGDHATNIAEEVIYLVKGRDVRHLDAQHKRANDSSIFRKAPSVP